MKNAKTILKGGCALALALTLVTASASAQLLDTFDLNNKLGSLSGPGVEIIIDKAPGHHETKELTAGNKASKLNGFRLGLSLTPANKATEQYSGKAHIKVVLSTQHGLTSKEAQALTSKDPSKAIVIYDKEFTVPPSGGTSAASGTRLLGVIGATESLNYSGPKYTDILLELKKQLNKRVAKTQQLTFDKDAIDTLPAGKVSAMTKMLSKKTSLYVIVDAPKGGVNDPGKLSFKTRADMALTAAKSTSG